MGYNLYQDPRIFSQFRCRAYFLSRVLKIRPLFLPLSWSTLLHVLFFIFSMLFFVTVASPQFSIVSLRLHSSVLWLPEYFLTGIFSSSEKSLQFLPRTWQFSFDIFWCMFSRSSSFRSGLSSMFFSHFLNISFSGQHPRLVYPYVRNIYCLINSDSIK